MRLPERLAAGAVVAVALVAGAWALWPTDVPDDLRLPAVDAREVFGVDELREAERFESFLHWNTLASMLVVLVVLALYARYGDRLARESAAGPIGTGMMLGMLGLGILWISQIPFGARRDLVGAAARRDEVGYLEWLLEYWLGLAGQFAFISLALVIVMGFAQVLRDRWWVAGAPTFVAIYVAVRVLAAVADRRRPAAPRSGARGRGAPVRARGGDDADSGAGRGGRARTPTRPTRSPAGMDASRKIFIWDTLLDGRFADDEVRVVLAHEIAPPCARAHLEEHRVVRALRRARRRS